MDRYCITKPEKPTKKVANWCQDDIFKCADQKRADLDTHQSFKVITDDFDENIPHVWGLINVVHVLRKTLIDDPEEATQRGALLNDPGSVKVEMSLNLGASIVKTPTKVDPFKERAKVADAIAKKLLEVMRVARNQARELLIKDEQKATTATLGL
ncbi:hypothetical protein EV175_006603 [Coemansia sp. RSA 1933]|nr:hypothetical protein EV175_006603 [Coemansia sp. RSA 1933]